jgi:hypothetical protein
MGQDFYRYVEGYNQPFCAMADALLARNTTLTFNAPAGPGRVERLAIQLNNPTTENLYIDTVTLIIDGTVICDIVGWKLTFDRERVDKSGPITGRIAGASYVIYQIVVLWDYLSSLSLVIKNVNSPDPTYYSILAWGRKGI